MSNRIAVLAQPKQLSPGYIENRRSLYWIDRAPFTPGPDGTTAFQVTSRLNELSQAKPLHPLFRPDRLTPIWAVSMGVKSGAASERTTSLAEPRKPHSAYQGERSPYTMVSPAAKSATATPRIDQLAQPKPHKVWGNSDDRAYRDMHYSKPITEVPSAALKATCSSRVEALASAKQPHSAFLGEKPVIWPVSDNAKNASATLRIQQLARPKSGKMPNEDYDPYIVPRSAKTAHASPRVSELAMPLARKVRQKKIV